MSDSQVKLSIAITPMHRTEEGVWESGGRQDAAFFLVELVQAEGEEVEVVLECRDERSAALSARVVAATLATLGLAGPEGDVSAFDEETARILADHETPEVAPASGAWKGEEEEDEDDAEDDADAEEEPEAGGPKPGA